MGPLWTQPQLQWRNPKVSRKEKLLSSHEALRNSNDMQMRLCKHGCRNNGIEWIRPAETQTPRSLRKTGSPGQYPHWKRCLIRVLSKSVQRSLMFKLVHYNSHIIFLFCTNFLQKYKKFKLCYAWLWWRKTNMPHFRKLSLTVLFLCFTFPLQVLGILVERCGLQRYIQIYLM